MLAPSVGERSPHCWHFRSWPGAVYRTNFQVQRNGHVSDATSEAGDGCVQRALRDWVATFIYTPINETATVAFDWMLVTAARNN